MTRVDPLRALLFVAGVGLAALTLAVARAHGVATTYAGASALAAGATAAMIVALAAAAALGRRPWPAAAAMLAVTLPVWAGTATATAPRALTEALMPVAIPLLLAVSGHVDRRLVAAATAVTTLLVAVSLLLRDPLHDLYCFADCLTSPFVVHRATGLARGANLAAGAVLALLALTAAARARGRAGLALLAAGLALRTVALAADPHETATRPALLLAYCLAAGGAATIGAAAAVDAIRALVSRRAVLRLARDLRADATITELEQALRRVAHDPTLVLLADGDAQPAHDVLAARISGREAARIAHRPGAARALERALGPSVRLALANATLRARLEQRVARLRETRERVVTLGDAARRGFERDLHDGAQQGVLAVLYELRLQAGRAGATGLAATLNAAADEAASALGELRELAHGIHPTILVEAGLRPALRSLIAGRADLARTPPGRYPPLTEATVYRVVDEAVHNAATHADPQRIVVTVVERSSALVATIEDDGAGGAHIGSDGGLAELNDRVGMCGGSLTVRSDTARGTVVEAVVPCG